MGSVRDCIVENVSDHCIVRGARWGLPVGATWCLRTKNDAAQVQSDRKVTQHILKYVLLVAVQYSSVGLINPVYMDYEVFGLCP
jgi:hypothetical protein